MSKYEKKDIIYYANSEDPDQTNTGAHSDQDFSLLSNVFFFLFVCFLLLFFYSNHCICISLLGVLTGSLFFASYR